MNSRNLDYMDFKQWVQGSRREESYQKVVYWPQNSVYPGFYCLNKNKCLIFEWVQESTNLISKTYWDYFCLHLRLFTFLER